MEIFNPGWHFNLLEGVEISSRLDSKLFFKMALQLHVKISTRYTELKFNSVYLIRDKIATRNENF